MPSSNKVDVKLTADVSKMLDQLLATQALLLHDLLASAGFERTDERIVQHAGSGVMIALNPDGYRISYYCTEARGGSGLIDLPPSVPVGQVAHLALALHRAEAERDEPRHVGDVARLVDGAAVSVDVSTGDRDAEARVFGRVYSAQREADGTLTLLAEVVEDTRADRECVPCLAETAPHTCQPEPEPVIARVTVDDHGGLTPDSRITVDGLVITVPERTEHAGIMAATSSARITRALRQWGWRPVGGPDYSEPGKVRIPVERIKDDEAHARSMQASEPECVPCLAETAPHTCQEGKDTVSITREQLDEWAGRALTDDEVAELDDAVPQSSIPEAIGTIAESLESGT